MVAKRADPSQDCSLGKGTWEEIAREAEKSANSLYGQEGFGVSKEWIAEFVRKPGFKKYVEELQGSSGDAGMPVAVLPESIAQGASPVLMLDFRPARKQRKRRGRQYKDSEKKFEWTEYSKLQSLVEKAEIIDVFDWNGAKRTVAGAADDQGQGGYAMVWDAKGGRNVLVTLFRPGEGRDIEGYAGWVARQKERIRTEKKELREIRRGRPRNPSQ